MSNTLLAVGGLLVGIAVGYFFRQFWAKKQLGSLEEVSQRKLQDTEAKAKEIIVEAKDKAASLLLEAKNEEKEHKNRIVATENRLVEREAMLDKRGVGLDEEDKTLKRKEEQLKEREGEVSAMRDKAATELERITGLSPEAAKEAMLAQVRERYQSDLAKSLQTMEQERHEEIEKKSGEIITVALQRYARTHVAELTTSLFHLPDEDLKGKIIGREGRNIRALERATGVEFVIDEAPGAIIISSFDPYRREVARMALEQLVKDGRIQPAKIEETVEEAKEALGKRMQEIGEAAATEVGVYDLPKEIIALLGRLHFRTSFGQNVLQHSIEMAFVADMMATELGLNAAVAKKGALVHDIGKAIDHEVEGTHVDLGMQILKKYSVDEKVIQAMQSHHEDYPYAIPEAYVVTAADVLSAARPGARRGTLENYIKRLQDLEKIANEFPGVKQSYAIAAGRELRVFVIPEKVDDFRALEMAREIANKIQSELKYPGEIKVNVIREMRAVEYAR
ncbi:MAG: ribonuclease Y [Candidatus Liptonbacteria bacterium RIFCSPHIGHO2_01_FULL_57_28]|uniref:Ribonuclease Y n=1 Tax=Candidatus Liptonbacteria bacterium RIFCSPHIGHO2_01_FULL_57_28 TaxID=1798647 RepID=A0A1G2C9Q5_9BACT|nr:MAG: ribonuclease Y [Candidatus Liptonbacteria bacterium RIFCSPHIGHO2_01_FULL_57_28]